VSSINRNVWFGLAALAGLTVAVGVYVFTGDPSKDQATNRALDANGANGAGTAGSGASHVADGGQSSALQRARDGGTARTGPTRPEKDSSPRPPVAAEVQKELKEKIASLYEEREQAKARLAAADPTDPDLRYVERAKRDRLERPLQMIALANSFSDPQLNKILRLRLSESADFNSTRKELQDVSTSLDLNIPFSGARDANELLHLIQINQEALGNASTALCTKYSITPDSRAAFETVTRANLQIRVLTSYLNISEPANP